MLSQMSKHSSQVTGAEFCRDDKMIITGSTDSIVHLWDFETKETLASFSCLGRLCSLDAYSQPLQFACGDGAGVLYVLEPKLLD
jgi:WD40 repeat protein